MNEQERLQKNARCDLLMKEGIDGPQEVDAVTPCSESAFTPAVPRSHIYPAVLLPCCNVFN